MFNSNPFSEYRAAQQKVQEKKAFDAESIDGSTVTDVDASIQEQKFVIPEEIPANERTAFHGAAAAAAKSGKKSFNFGGKSHPVTMAKDTAHKIADDTQKEMSSKEKMKKGLYNDTQKEGMYKDMDTEKSEQNPRSDDKVKSDMKKRRKKEDKTEVEMNPKMAMGKKDSSMEQKESTIREKLLAVLSENDRAKHYKGATKPETMDDKLSGQGAKDMMNQPKEVEDVKKALDKTTAAGKTGPTAKPRSGGDNTRNGDQKIVQGGTPVNKLTKTMEAYASMYEEKQQRWSGYKNIKHAETNDYNYETHGGVHHERFPKGQQAHPKVMSAAKKIKHDDHTVDYMKLKGGHELHTHAHDEGDFVHIHHIHNGEHKGTYKYNVPHEKRDHHPGDNAIKTSLKHAPPHVVKAASQHLNNKEDDLHRD